ncbi:ATP-binding protein [Pseudaestuariivita rosea]|uniref:ATP-binding protein n=1 Tax=Pseudaestuariivita rosea TaxID=2763263 RepID=UPI001ABB457F|nr:ATP-binding protein [Pseudaestuariivita rosea]
MAALVAVATIFGLFLLIDLIIWGRFEQTLPPHLLAEYIGNEPMSDELVDRMNAHLPDRLFVLITIGVSLSGLMAGAGVAMAGGRRLLRPLALLSEAARDLSEGDLTARVETKERTTEEVARFIRDFNTMAAAAERSERERRESAAAVAHELRTPLTVLSGRLHGMLDGVFPMDRQALSALLTQVELLSQIVEDLRLLTLFEAGRLTLDIIPTDLARIAEDHLHGIQLAVIDSDTVIESTLSQAPIDGDTLRITQALQALLSNAITHGDGTIRVETGSDSMHSWLRVMDRGPGLTQAQAHRAFDRFWQADVSRGSKGSGLGLSVVMAIAKAHGAKASYTDRPGGGALFEIRFTAAVRSVVSTVSPQNAETT